MDLEGFPGVLPHLVLSTGAFRRAGDSCLCPVYWRGSALTVGAPPSRPFTFARLFFGFPISFRNEVHHFDIINSGGQVHV